MYRITVQGNMKACFHKQGKCRADFPKNIFASLISVGLFFPRIVYGPCWTLTNEGGIRHAFASLT